MPEYLAPGVFVEETSFQSKTIEGVSTTTTGFIGPASFGPVSLEPEIVTSIGEFEQAFWSGAPLAFWSGAPLPLSDVYEAPNFLWHAARAFFTEGGKRLYVARVFKPLKGDYTPDISTVKPVNLGSATNPVYADGHARVTSSHTGSVAIRSRHPGAAGNLRVKLTLKGRPNVLGSVADPITGERVGTLGALSDKDLVWIRDAGSPAEQRGVGAFYIAHWNEDRSVWEFEPPDGSPPSGGERLSIDGLFNGPEPNSGDAVRVVTLAVTLQSRDGQRDLTTWSDLPLDPRHRSGGGGNSVFHRFATLPPSAADARLLPLVFAYDDVKVSDAFDVLRALFGADPTSLLEPDSSEQARDIEPADKLGFGVSVHFPLDGGNDGMRPQAKEYEGESDPKKGYSLGLAQFEDLEDISIVAAPGVTWAYQHFRDDANAITGLLIAHAERMRYRIAVLDSAEGQTIAEVLNMRAKVDSKYAALYYPWVKVMDPVTRTEIHLPPSGFVAGIYARNDVERAVYKAPANEVVRLALGFETLLSKGQQEMLNPEGVNCFRYFEGRGYRLWGARTISSDSEWKYVNVRRYFAYVERSIDRGTQWVVFEPNGEQLWGNVRRTIEDFLLNEWQSGALLGDKPERAFFVRCDRSTMTQNDLDNGRLICLIGIAPLKPAEFVIFRIGQWTADRKV